MKNLYLLSMLVSLCSAVAFASEIPNKSLRVGDKDDQNPFSICVANQAVDQLLIKTQSYLRLMHSSPDLDNQPAMKATLVFITQTNGSPKKGIFQVVLNSLDENLGWQSIQYSNGEIAPYSTLISSQGAVLDAKGNLVGDVDLLDCTNQ